MSNTRVCLLGFGEVGQALAIDMLARAVNVSSWDVQFMNRTSAVRCAVDSMQIRRADDARDGVRDADLVISAVTAAEAVKAAESVAPYIRRDTYYMDLNSVSPDTKIRVGELIEKSQARFIEAAVMSPIAPKRSASPILLGGPHAQDFLPFAQRLGFSGAEVFSQAVGRASAAKMCRSVMIKGMEALLAESLLAARHYGVEENVIASLRNLLPHDNWPALARYMISRSLIHGKRRAEEMREVAQTVREAGINPEMSLACVQRQQWASQYPAAATNEELTSMLDQLLGHANRAKQPC